jgi:hypothetical protein
MSSAIARSAGLDGLAPGPPGQGPNHAPRRYLLQAARTRPTALAELAAKSQNGSGSASAKGGVLGPRAAQKPLRHRGPARASGGIGGACASGRARAWPAPARLSAAPPVCGAGLICWRAGAAAWTGRWCGRPRALVGA